jgi:hypothetical protein
MLICKYSLWPIFFIQKPYARQRPYARKKWGVAGTLVARHPCRDKKMKRSANLNAVSGGWPSFLEWTFHPSFCDDNKTLAGFII